jgi:phospholipase/lecithinase/hemolysin
MLEDRRLPSGLIGNLVVFGDSLSDTGNDAIATGGAFPNPAVYYQGRFSNGPIWVDALAQALGEPAVRPSLAGGLDYAYGGATVAFQNQPPPFNAFPRLSQQVNEYLAAHHSAGDDLLAVWGGANDFIESFSSPTGPINPILSADTLSASLETLAHRGGREFIVPNLPPLGEAAFFRGLGIPALSAAADQWTAAFDAELAADISNFKSDHPDAIVVSLDVAGLYQQIVQPSNPFGFVNTTDAVGPLVPGSVFLAAVTATDPQDYLFYDGVHPTSKAHQLLGMQAAAELLNALPGHHLLIGSQQIGANVAGKAGDSSANAATMLGSKGTLLVAGADYTVLNDSDTVAGLIKPRTSIAIVGGDELFAWDTAKVAFEVL